MSWLWLFLALLLVLLLWLDVIGKIRAYRRLCRCLKNIPGLPPHWLLGNAHQIQNDSKTLMWLQKEVSDNRYKITSLWFGPFFCGVSVHHPDLVQQLLKTPKATRVYGMLEPWLGEGLLIAGGSKWFRNRRLLTPAFHFEILRPYVQVYNDCASILLSKWEKKAARGEPVPLYQDISQLTLDVVMRCAFSYYSNCQAEEQDSEYIKSVKDLCHMSSERFSSVLAQNDFIFFYCTFTGWHFRKAMKIAHKHSEKVIKERRAALNIQRKNSAMTDFKDVLSQVQSTRKHLDFLDVLLIAEDESGCGLTDLEIRNEVDTFMFEGHDTTANGLMWTLYLLAKHPEHQDKCREEIRSILQGREQLEYDDMSKLQYTHWCIKESLRLFPPVFNIFRELTKDVELGGFLVPKDVSYVCIDIMSVHRNPEIWQNPEEFDPLRFHPESATNRHPYAYLPFSAGPRNCIGQVFALNEEKVVIGSILNKFRIALSLGSDQKEEPTPFVLLRNSCEVLLQLTPDRGAALLDSVVDYYYHTCAAAKMASSAEAGSSSCLVTLVTCSNLDEAKKLSRNIVKSKLAACVNIIPQVTSVYEWESKIEEDTESMMVIKTMKDKLPDLVAHIQKEHSYDVPEVIAVKVEGGSVPYLKWVENTCNPKTEN